ncbi:family 43 glycosylhydrolase [Paenibacillus gorillae]|uniref:family 43 glycosylhydrolase n=1 Tax=Paenibacillus gorillae TaxID=1243662 RepID=UPI0004B21BF3|nr:family 43 glycosylhydrolase [Paenibacillus gorillae]
MKNPIITSIFTADPSAHVWEDGKVYIYASHDMDPARGCDLMDRYHVFSSEDMVNWVDEGEILRSDDVSWGRTEGGFMWAPDAAYRNGTYYFYYPHPSGTAWNDTWKIGVATSKKPASEFTDQGYITGLGGFAMIDPCVFVDDDNRAYMYYGGGSKCAGGELNDDMMSMKHDAIEMEGLEDFHEATWVFKRNGIYYLTYSDNLDGLNQMRYAISDNPLGPWTYKGVFLEPTGCSTSHGSVAEFKGQWYLFYHNQDISDQGNLRSVCIDYLHFNEDGTIQTVVQTREGGIKPVGPSKAANPNQIVYAADQASVHGGAALLSDDQGNAVIGSLNREGAYCQFDGLDGLGGGRTSIEIRYATEERLAKINLNVNGEDFSLLNALSTGSLSDYTGITNLTVPFKAGAVNSVKLTGGNGELRIASIAVSSFED